MRKGGIKEKRKGRTGIPRVGILRRKRKQREGKEGSWCLPRFPIQRMGKRKTGKKGDWDGYKGNHPQGEEGLIPSCLLASLCEGGNAGDRESKKKTKEKGKALVPLGLGNSE